MPPAEFGPAIPASERMQTHAIDYLRGHWDRLRNSTDVNAKGILSAFFFFLLNRLLCLCKITGNT